MDEPLILVVDDDSATRLYLSQLLREEGLGVRVASNGVEAVVAMEAEEPDLVLSDLHMPTMDGLELLAHVTERWPDLPFLLLSVVEDTPTVVEAVQRGAVNYLIKSASPTALLKAVKEALQGVRKRPGRAERGHEILGESRSAAEVRRLVELASSSDVNVLVTGETGTGKELVARAVHRYSDRSAGPFVAHNCAATPNELFESQFFGHRRGAFTGALDNHTGLLEEANGSVLLLDELQSLSAPVQAKLLRVLDDGEIRPVGATKTQRVSVRFVAATNRDPLELVAKNVLREDLYYRLRGLEIRLPPLRERREDIPLLSRHFLESHGGELSPAALEVLSEYSWPGNVRQLRNVVRSAQALSGGRRIEPHHLLLDSFSEKVPTEDTTRASTRQTLREIERRAILAALRTHDGNLSRAARALGIDRSTLRRKLQRLQLEER